MLGLMLLVVLAALLALPTIRAQVLSWVTPGGGGAGNAPSPAGSTQTRVFEARTAQLPSETTLARPLFLTERSDGFRVTGPRGTLGSLSGGDYTEAGTEATSCDPDASAFDDWLRTRLGTMTRAEPAPDGMSLTWTVEGVEYRIAFDRS